MFQQFQDECRPIYGAADAELLAISNIIRTIDGIRYLNENCTTFHINAKITKNSRLKNLFKILFSHRAIWFYRKVASIYKILQDML